VQLSARVVTLELAERFVISRGAQETADVVHVQLGHAGETGYGEAAPTTRYGESADKSLAFLEGLDDLGGDPFAHDEIEARLAEHPGQRSAKAAIDAALHDLGGKLIGLPTWRFLGLRRAGPPTSWTIWLGDPDDMARRAEAVDGRFKRLKLKLGGGDGLDVERVRAVRAATSVPLQVDVNEYWTLDEALESLPQLAKLGVDYCEQPLPAGDPDGPSLKERSQLPIYVDEDCHVLDDVAACAERAHGINIKLAKSGGIREGIRMVHAGRALGLHVMLGCMLESGLGIAAGAQMASLCDHVDLDGNLLLREDPWPGVLFVDGVQLPSESPGLGVREAVSDPR
jgi:L-alanine-DL-glutamate epimerase-like enolase superfamily enzyme